MRIAVFLTILLYSAFPTLCSAEDSLPTENNGIEVCQPEQNACLESQEYSELAARIVGIKEQHMPNRDNIYYFEINIAESTMSVFQVVLENKVPCMKLLSEHLVGTPKVKDYPRGFGIITSVEINPHWIPTEITIREFAKQGIDLSRFRGKDGKVVVPPGSRLNYMGSAKMNITFVTPQKTAKTRRNVYRIHGIIPTEHYKKMLGTRCSGGCIRVDNQEIKDLIKLTQNAAIVINYM